MKKMIRKKAVRVSALLSAAVLLVGLAGGTALAYNTAHDDIVLKDAAGVNITSLTAVNNAYSVKTTCFGTVGCHGDNNAPGNAKFDYAAIEKHSYHAQNGTNEFKGFDPYNPDGWVPEFDANGVATGGKTADVFRRGVSAKGKNWVQSPGHVGNW